MAMAAASRRMSVAPVNRAASNIRNMSGRHGSMFYGRSTFMDGKVFLMWFIHSFMFDKIKVTLSREYRFRGTEQIKLQLKTTTK